MKAIQFPSLNGLRFLAAFGVIIHHAEQVKLLNGLPNIVCCPLIANLGGLSVSLFFVLSGFLITFLLLQEAKQLQSISIAKFYVRRILRIWPLYFIICFLGFVVLPNFSAYNVSTFSPVWDSKGWLKAILYCLFLPHVAASWLSSVAYAGVLWSVGVEEWFYLIWPWIVKYFHKSKFLLLVNVIIVLSICKIVFPLSSGSLGTFLYYLRFNCMAVGALFAILLHNKEAFQSKRLLSFFYRRDLQIFTYSFLATAMILGWSFGPIGSPMGELIYAILFGTIILNMATNKRSLINLEMPPLRWLGDISYGLYCYNWIAIVTGLLLLKQFVPGLRPHALGYAVVGLGVILTIAISALSYEFIERRFLLLKQRFFTRLSTLTVKGSQREPQFEMPTQQFREPEQVSQLGLESKSLAD